MRTTSKEAAKGESELEKKLRSRQGIQAQVGSCHRRSFPAALLSASAGVQRLLLPIHSMCSIEGALLSRAPSCQPLNLHNCTLPTNIQHRTAAPPHPHPLGAPARLQMLAKAQRERLQVMLDEIKDRSAHSEARYRAALDGQSLGTHSVGSSAGAVAIKRGEEGGAAAAAATSVPAAAAAQAAGAAGQQAEKGKGR